MGLDGTTRDIVIGSRWTIVAVDGEVMEGRTPPETRVSGVRCTELIQVPASLYINR